MQGEFRDLYAKLSRIEPETVVRIEPGRLVTLSADGMQLAEFVRSLSDQTGVSVVVSDRLDDKRVTLDVKQVEIGMVLDMLARRMGVQVSRNGDVFFIGELRPEDRGVLVHKVRRLTRDEIVQIASVYSSDTGRLHVTDDGLLIVGDRVAVLDRIREMVERVEAVPVDTWVFQLHMVSMRRDDMSEFGFDVLPAADVALTFARAAGGDLTSTATAAASLQAILRADRERSSVDIVAEPMLLVAEGQTGSFIDGENVPVPRRSVSDQGTVTTVGFDFFQTGLEVEVIPRELAYDRGRFDIRVSIADITGFVNDAPIVNRQQLDIVLTAASGGVYLIGSLDRGKRFNATTTAFQTVKKQDSESSVVQVWLRAYRIDGGGGIARRSEAETGDPSRVLAEALPGGSP
jgi:type II secretory pathway component GspD/PulD (secretin)